MNNIDVANQYFDAWNNHDSNAIVATFADGGTYSDPASGGELTGPAIGGYASGLFAGFPDLSFDIVSVASTGEDSVSAQWVMKGTNSGDFAGGPPTGGSITLPGADFITIEDGKMKSVQGYFDQRTLVEQLGLQVIVQPYQIGPVQWGSAVRMNLGNPAKPGAISLTWIAPRSEEEGNKIRDFTQKIIQELPKAPGFLGLVTASLRDKMFSITAWDSADDAAKLTQDGPHKEAMSEFFSGNLGSAASTSVWVQERINAVWVRCGSCDQISSYDRDEGRCQCGEALPDPPPYW